MLDPNYHEIWWIFSPYDQPWAGLHLAHFRIVDGFEIVIIPDDAMWPGRYGPREWLSVKQREGWIKIERIHIPTKHQVQRAMSCTPKPIGS